MEITGGSFSNGVLTLSRSAGGDLSVTGNAVGSVSGAISDGNLTVSVNGVSSEAIALTGVTGTVTVREFTSITDCYNEYVGRTPNGFIVLTAGVYGTSYYDAGVGYFTTGTNNSILIYGINIRYSSSDVVYYNQYMQSSYRDDRITIRVFEVA